MNNELVAGKLVIVLPFETETGLFYLFNGNTQPRSKIKPCPRFSWKLIIPTKQQQQQKKKQQRENNLRIFHVPYHAPNAKFIILIDISN